MMVKTQVSYRMIQSHWRRFLSLISVGFVNGKMDSKSCSRFRFRLPSSYKPCVIRGVCLQIQMMTRYVLPEVR